MALPSLSPDFGPPLFSINRINRSASEGSPGGPIPLRRGAAKIGGGSKRGEKEKRGEGQRPSPPADCWQRLATVFAPSIEFDWHVSMSVCSFFCRLRVSYNRVSMFVCFSSFVSQHEQTDIHSKAREL